MKLCSRNFLIFFLLTTSLPLFGAAIFQTAFWKQRRKFIRLEITSNTTNYNIRNVSMAAGWNGSSPVTITVTINPGVVVYSTDFSGVVAAITTGVLPAGSILSITNNGSIFGQTGTTHGLGNWSKAATAAIQIDYQATVINNGLIVGGKGIAGSNDGDACCGSGNGGSPGGAGGAGFVFNSNATITNTGSIFAGGGGGGGGGGAYAAGVGSGWGGNGQGGFDGANTINANGSCTFDCGGTGGMYGQNGTAGGANVLPGGAGGLGGYAMVLNGHIVTLNETQVIPISSFTESDWMAGTKGRIAQ